MSADEEGRLRETMKHIQGSGVGLTAFQTLWKLFYHRFPGIAWKTCKIFNHTLNSNVVTHLRRKNPCKGDKTLHPFFSHMLLMQKKISWLRCYRLKVHLILNHMFINVQQALCSRGKLSLFYSRYFKPTKVLQCALANISSSP